jgi:hypothetical protein
MHWSPTSTVWGGGQPAEQQGSAELGKSLLTLLPVPGSSAAAGCFRAAAAATAAAAAAAEAGAGEERVRGAGGGGGEEEGLVSWIRMVLLSQGGKVPGAQLGGILASSDPKRYRRLKRRFGGLIPLLSRYPELFVLANDPPLNHVLVVAPASSGAAGSHGSPFLGGQALRSTPPTRSTSPQRAKKALCPLSPSRALQNVEIAVAECAAVALRAAPGQALKAVELANALRAQLGTEVLASCRDYHGGLLSLLERNTAFEVTRVPKLDTVKLRAAAAGDDGSGGGAVAPS